MCFGTRVVWDFWWVCDPVVETESLLKLTPLGNSSDKSNKYWILSFFPLVLVLFDMYNWADFGFGFGFWFWSNNNWAAVCMYVFYLNMFHLHYGGLSKYASFLTSLLCVVCYDCVVCLSQLCVFALNCIHLLWLFLVDLALFCSLQRSCI